MLDGLMSMNFSFGGCNHGRQRTSPYKVFWWAHQDSNLEPKDYESSALTVEL
jgi:hypothetical protein